jgi:alpha-galactosidase
VLDVTHPDAAEWLADTFRTLTAWGFTYHKIDFLYAGAMPGRRHADATPLEAYGEGLRSSGRRSGRTRAARVRRTAAAEIGRVDAMRISPDIDPDWEPPEGDVSQPSQLGAVLAGRARSWQHGRWWVNDPDCILCGRGRGPRGAVGAELAQHGGLAVSGDPLGALDERGLAWTRALLLPTGRRGRRGGSPTPTTSRRRPACRR